MTAPAMTSPYGDAPATPDDLPLEADEADAVEQAVEVPLDDEALDDR